MKNKKVIFAIILFLLIGLTIFTFANPSSNEKTFDEGQKEIQDGDGNTKDDTNTTIEENNGESDIATNDNNTNEVPNNIMVGNQDQNVTIVRDQITANAQNNNDNYNNALAAVVKAESTITQSDVYTARDLVEKLDDGNEKSNLENRLEQVQDIIDVSGLVATLEGKTNSAKSRDDILAARKYRDVEQKIKERVESLKESKEKDDLESRLNDLSSILDDNTAPKITGVKDKSYINADNVPVKLELDSEDYTVTVNDTEYTDELSFSEDGTYTVTVTDNAFNETTVKFTIDTIKPTFKNIKNGLYLDVKSLKVDVEDDNPDKITSYGKEIDSVLTEEGIYYLVATDKAGNTSDGVYVGIDRTAPEFKDIKNGDIFNEEKTIEIIEKVRLSEVTVYNQTTKETTKYGLMDLLGKNKVEVKNDGVYIITAKDCAGHTTEIEITIDTKLVIDDARIYNTDTSKRQLAKIGDTVRFEIYTKDDLKSEPVLTIDDIKLETNTLSKRTTKDGEVYYRLDVVIPEDNSLTEGENIKFNIYVEDISGHSANITNENISKYAKEGSKLTYVEYDVIPYPTIVAHYNEDAGEIIPENSRTNAERIIYIIEWSEAVNDFTGADVIFENFGIEHIFGDLDVGKNYKYLAQTPTIANEENEATITIPENAVTDKNGNGNEKVSFTVTVDRKAPTATKVTMSNKTMSSDEVTVKSAKDGDWILVSATFDEKLKKDPILKIGGNEGRIVSTSLNEDESGLYTYVMEVNLPAGIPDGNVPFTITNISDDLGNVSDDINKVIGDDSVWVKVDNTKSDIYVGASDRSSQKEVDGLFYTNDSNINVYDDNPFTFVVTDENGKIVTDEVLSNREEPNKFGKYLFRSNVNGTRTDGKYTVQVTDEAGNVSKLTYVLDKTHPTVGYDGISDDKKLTGYRRIELSDDNPFTYTIKNSEGSVVRSGKNESSFIMTKNYKDGEYTIEVVDVAGNKTTEQFIIDYTAPSIKIYDTVYGPDTTEEIRVIAPSIEGEVVDSDIAQIKLDGEVVEEVNHTPTGSGKMHGVYVYTLIDDVGNESTYNVNFTWIAKNESSVIQNAKPGDVIHLSKDSGAFLRSEVNIPEGVTIIGNGATIKYGDTPLKITNDNVTLIGLNVNLNNGDPVEITGNNITIDGGTYERYDTKGNGIQGEGVIRVENSKDVNIYNTTLHGGIALINFSGNANIYNNTIILDYKGETPIVGINITTGDEERTYSAESLYKAQKEFKIGNPDYSYYVRIQHNDEAWTDIDSLKISDYKETSTVDEKTNSSATNVTPFKEEIFTKILPFSKTEFDNFYTKNENEQTESDDIYTKDEQIEVEADVLDNAGIIWWAEFSCDTEKCEGFREHGSDKLSEKVIEGRRGEVRSITMDAPKAKDGYKFVGWKKYEATYNDVDFPIQGFEAIYDEVESNEKVKQTVLNDIINISLIPKLFY